MADLPELSEWTSGIYQLETSDPVLAGPEGIDNLQAKQLANRTKWLKDKLDQLDAKHSVRVATTADVALGGVQTIDGVALVAGDRVLVKDQAAAAANGIYVVAAGAWSRAVDADASIEVTPGLFVPVEQGTANADSVWQLATDGPIALGTTALTFEASAGPSGVSAGSYRSVTVDKRGRVTGGTNPAELMALSRVTSLSVNGPIAADQMGLVLLDATGGARTFTLPAANGALGVVELILRRVDVTSNALVIAADGTDKLMLDTTAEAAGQASTELLFVGDYLRLRSDGAGKWWCVGQAQLPGGLAHGLVAYTAAGVSTFTVPAVLRSGRMRPRVVVTGGGGGGGGGSSVSPPARGGGGGAGGTAIGIVNLAGVTSVTVTVGAGGAGGAASTNGANGQTSSFGTYLTATGGQQGGGASSSNQPAGGGGGSGSGGALILAGGQGSDGPVQSGTGTGGAGDGGGSFWGGGSRAASGVATGPAAAGCGGGGTDVVGGSGTPGIVEIQW